MTIKRATDRIWSCDTLDTKPEGWAPGLLMLETDTGVWWVTGEDRRWMPCYATAAQHQALVSQFGDLVAEMVTMRADIATMRADIALLKAARPAGGQP